MKSPSNDNNEHVEQRMNAALDHSVDSLSSNARDDIYKARQAALRAMHAKEQPNSVSSRFRHMIVQPFPRAATGVACAVLIALSLNYSSVEPVPALPVAMLTEDVPTEDLSLLEDLEFVAWLAENESEALL